MRNVIECLTSLGSPEILIIGDLMLDRTVTGHVDRVSPEAPVIVLSEEQEDIRPGGAANVAMFVQGLGGVAHVCGVTGTDDDGRLLAALLTDAGIDASGILRESNRPTTTKQRFVSRESRGVYQQLIRTDREWTTAISAESEAELIGRIDRILPTCHAVLLSDYGKGVCTTLLVQEVIRSARSLQVPVLVDPALGSEYAKYAGATVIVPNRKKLSVWANCTSHDLGPLQAAMQRMRHKLNLQAVVTTMDQDGLAYSLEQHCELVPCRSRRFQDPTGAGDMVLTVLGLCRAEEIPWRESFELANAAAGMEVERRGVEAISRQELLKDLSGRPKTEAKIVSRSELPETVSSFRRSGQSIVFTNGCFDWLHPGHLALLQGATCWGDRLIVGINSDASVRRLKGALRPVLGSTDRAAMLAALECVDCVVVFDEDTPHALLETIRPDVLIKGGTTTQIVGREIVEAYGGQVVQASAVPDWSTTMLLSNLASRDRSTGRVLEEAR